MKPEEIFANASEEIRSLAGKVLKIEKEHLFDRKRLGIFDKLINIFKREIK
jgi:hypothetical protein